MRKSPVPSRLYPAAIVRIVHAVVRAEVARLRGDGGRFMPSGEWTGYMPLGDEGLGIDSLETFGILAALAEMFDLDAGMLAEYPPERLEELIDWVAQAPSGAEARIWVTTSGSTGNPRRCGHAFAELLEEAAYFASMAAGRRRVVAMVPANHLYGLIWTALLPAVLDVPVVERRIGARLDHEPGDLIVAVPDQWRVLPRLAAPLPDDVWGVSSGGPLSRDVEMAMLEGGVAHILDVYGASELGGIAVRVAPDPSHRLLPRWRLSVGDDAVIDRRGKQWPLPDQAIRTGERAIQLIGRRDEAVQVGGHNVWPDRIAAMLRAVPGVADAAVRLGDDARLKAFVVPASGVAIDNLQQSFEQCTATLSVAERPSSYVYGAALPRNPMGKRENWS